MNQRIRRRKNHRCTLQRKCLQSSKCKQCFVWYADRLWWRSADQRAKQCEKTKSHQCTDLTAGNPAGQWEFEDKHDGGPFRGHHSCDPWH